jgi:hypothetical protein
MGKLLGLCPYKNKQNSANGVKYIPQKQKDMIV